MIRLRLLSLLILALLLSSTATADSAHLPSVMSTRYFTVHYDPSDPFLAKLMAETARDELFRISRDLGYSPDPSQPFPLYVYPSHIGFIRAGGLETRKFTVGLARSGSAAISVDASGAFAAPQQVLAHEVTHAVIFRILGSHVDGLPLWMNEGLAEYESDGLSDDDRAMIAEAAADGTLIPLPDLAQRFPEKRTALSYAESGSAAEYLVRRHGRNAPHAVLRELARSGSFERAMRKATGAGADAFASDWYAWTTRRYWALKIGRIGAAVISAVMAILLIPAFLVRRRQKIEAAKRWEEEEREGNDWFDGRMR